MIRRPPRSTLDRSSAASDVYKRQGLSVEARDVRPDRRRHRPEEQAQAGSELTAATNPVSYTHLRAHETVLDLVCRLLLEKKKKNTTPITHPHHYHRHEHIIT